MFTKCNIISVGIPSSILFSVSPAPVFRSAKHSCNSGQCAPPLPMAFPRLDGISSAGCPSRGLRSVFEKWVPAKSLEISGFQGFWLFSELFQTDATEQSASNAPIKQICPDIPICLHALSHAGERNDPCAGFAWWCRLGSFG